MTDFVLLPGEPPAAAVRRIVTEQIDGAIGQLQRLDELDEGIHEARKHFKRIRAVLRLVRGPLPEEIYDAENVFFRDAGRVLSPLRDSAVHMETLDLLKETFEEQLSAEAFGTVRAALDEKHQAVLQSVKSDPQTLAAIRASLADARQRVGGWPLPAAGFDLFAKGLKKIYKRGRKEKVTAWDQPSAENFHAWRKRVKYLWYHTTLLQPVWPALMDALEDELDLLSDLLGEEHDLAVLHETLAELAPAAVDEKSAELLAALIARERNQRQQAAWPVGERIYQEKPGRFLQRLAGYWQVYQCAADSEGAR